MPLCNLVSTGLNVLVFGEGGGGGGGGEVFPSLKALKKITAQGILMSTTIMYLFK